mgnify:CR=1 FL=1
MYSYVRISSLLETNIQYFIEERKRKYRGNCRLLVIFNTVVINKVPSINAESRALHLKLWIVNGIVYNLFSQRSKKTLKTNLAVKMLGKVIHQETKFRSLNMSKDILLGS